MSHSKKWRETLPTSFTSPFFAQGDLGFFSSKTKKYGAFFLAVNSYTGLIHVSKISNTKMDTLVTAIGHMSKVIPRKKDINHHHHNYDSNVQDKNFVDIRTVLFDGESALKSKRAQKLILDKYNIVLHADPGVKRNQAEREIRGLKIVFSCLQRVCNL